MMTTVLALIEALPKIIALFKFLAGMVRDAEQRGLGRKEAVAEALTIAHKDLALADAAENEAIQAHRANPHSDAGFDPDGERKD